MKVNQNPKEKQKVYTNKVINSQNLEMKKKESFGVLRWPLKNLISFLNPKQKANRNTDNLKHGHLGPL